MLLSPPTGSLMSVEWADVPRPNLKDVLHCGTVAQIWRNDPKEIQQSRKTQ